MGILHPTAPAGFMAPLRLKLQAIVDGGHLGQEWIDPAVRVEDLTVSEPHRVYTVGLDEVVEGLLLEKATARGWRVMLLHEEKAIADVDMFENEAGELKLQALHFGPQVDGFLQAHVLAEAESDILEHDYELRCLRAPALFFAALWLHREGDDLIIPHPPSQWVHLFRAYREQELLGLLQPAARDAVAAHDRLK